MNVVLVVLLTALAHAARSFFAGEAMASAGTAMSLGYLLLAGLFVGDLFKKVRLPKLTGYIMTGIVAGPAVLDVVPVEALERLALFSGVAVALIALTAGLEMEIAMLRPLYRTIKWVSLFVVGGATLVLAGAVLALGPLLPFMNDLSLGQRIAVALVLGVSVSAKSPAVVVALRKEVEADGPISRTVLALVVIGDLLVILLFAVVSSIAKSAFGTSEAISETAKLLAWEIVGSLVAGLVVGGIMAIYVRKVERSAALFIVAVCFVVAEVGRRLHLDPLLVCLSAGMLVRNATRVGDRLHDHIETSSMPVYIVFFAVAGATIHLDVLVKLGVPVIVLVLVRGVTFVLGTRVGARLAGAPPEVRKYAGFGLLPQAGLALALAMLLAKAFPEFGAEAGALILGIVGVNEIVAPAIYRFALVKSGEAGATAKARDSLAPNGIEGAPTEPRAT
jgi:Kef-type K+ transport system membrane component KefB